MKYDCGESTHFQSFIGLFANPRNYDRIRKQDKFASTKPINFIEMKKSIIPVFMVTAMMIFFTVTIQGQTLKTGKFDPKPKKTTGVAYLQIAGDTAIKEVVGYPLKDEMMNAESRTINRLKELVYENESGKSEIKISSSDEYNFIRINLLASVEAGTIGVEIVDPGGTKQGNFIVKADEGTMTGSHTKALHDQVTGEMQKDFRVPAKGDWIIRAIPQSATGSLRVGISQRYIYNLDYIDTRSIK
jgi:hypothetical protein